MRCLCQALVGVALAASSVRMILKWPVKTYDWYSVKFAWSACRSAAVNRRDYGDYANQFKWDSANGCYAQRYAGWGIASPYIQRLRDCMSNGTTYVAKVTAINGGQVRVSVYAIWATAKRSVRRSSLLQAVPIMKLSFIQKSPVYGSAGRAASALATLGVNVDLYTYADEVVNSVLRERACFENFTLHTNEVRESVIFHYEHGLAEPRIFNYPDTPYPAITVKAPCILRYGMLEDPL